MPINLKFRDRNRDRKEGVFFNNISLNKTLTKLRSRNVYINLVLVQ